MTKLLSALLTLVALAAVVAVFLLETTQTSPGPLHPVHAQVAELGDCASCHPDEGTPTDACLVCHEEVARRRAEGIGLHADPRPCAVCHGEHFGDEPVLLSPASFRLAGVEDLESFDHAGLDLGLVGRHRDLACVDCHPAAHVDVLAVGGSRYLGIGRSCTSCHEDAHEGAYGNRCQDCHDQDLPFIEARGRAHDRFPLTGVHAETPCADCHPADGPHSIAASLEAVPAVRTCAVCHDSPHGTNGVAVFLAGTDDCARCHETQTFARTFGVEEHRALGVDLGGAHASLECAACHAPGRPRVETLADCGPCHGDPHGPDPVDPGATTLVFGSASTLRKDCAGCHGMDRFSPAAVTGADHARFGTPLAGAHRALDCAACHARDGAALPGGIEECAACHESPHRPEFEGEDGCADCHTEVAFHPTELAAERHRATGFALDVPHDRANCEDCHPGPGARPFAERFPGRAADACAECHDDPHGDLTARGAFAGASCVECHASTHFVPAAFPLAAHERTGWPLTGSHTAVPCASCHEDRLTFTIDGTTCASCHESSHAFEDDACEACHDNGSFQETIVPFEHGRLTKFPLVGAHEAVPCGECHGTTEARPPTACASCHGDPHAGQFSAYGPDQCVRCHSPNDFSLTSFDHAKQSRFALDGRHADVPCADCHRPQRTRTGEMVVRYRPIPHECSDCHEAGGG